MRELLDCCSEVPLLSFASGTTLLSQGEETGRLYVLARGRIAILRGATEVAILSEPGSVVGDMSILLRVPHTATARALTEVEAHVVEDGTAFFRDHPEASYLVAQTLAQRLNGATTYLVDLKKQFASESNHLEMVGDVLESLIYRQRPRLVPGSDRDRESP